MRRFAGMLLKIVDQKPKNFIKAVENVYPATTFV
jgi:hypothetical protein